MSPCQRGIGAPGNGHRHAGHLQGSDRARHRRLARIGRAVARRLAAEGTDVAISYASRTADAEATPGEIRALGVRGLASPCDVSRPDDVARLATEVRERLGSIDVFVHCGAISNLCDHTELDLARRREMIDVNLTGAHLVPWAVEDEMIRRRSGRIVMITSLAALRPRPMQIHHTTAKAGGIALTRCCAEARAPHGVRVNCVAPGLIETEMLHVLPRERIAAVVKDAPMGRVGQPEEVVAAVRFLPSDESSFVTGQTL
jgi:3-oxoacyl-[acyl-carrier protein] reductase